jgi:hypothetical protein
VEYLDDTLITQTRDGAAMDQLSHEADRMYASGQLKLVTEESVRTMLEENPTAIVSLDLNGMRSFLTNAHKSCNTSIQEERENELRAAELPTGIDILDFITLENAKRKQSVMDHALKKHEAKYVSTRREPQTEFQRANPDICRITEQKKLNLKTATIQRHEDLIIRRNIQANPILVEGIKMSEDESPAEFVDRIGKIVKERTATEETSRAMERGREIEEHARRRAKYEVDHSYCIERILYKTAGPQICKILRVMSRSEDSGVRNLGVGMNEALFLIMKRVASYCRLTLLEVCEVLDVTTTMHLFSDAMDDSRNMMIMSAFSPQFMVNRSEIEKESMQREIDILQGEYTV